MNSEGSKIIFVRHGETDWNALRRIQGQSESQLNETGKLQAATLRPRIEAMGIDSIYSGISLSCFYWRGLNRFNRCKTVA